MTEAEGDARARRAWRIAGWGGLGFGSAMAATAAFLGAGGAVGLRYFLAGVLFTTTIGALYAVVTGAIDTVRGRPVGRSRVVAAFVLGFLALLVLPSMLLGLAR